MRRLPFLRKLFLLLLRLIPAWLRRQLVLWPYEQADRQLVAAQRDAERAQQLTLVELTRRQAATVFGREHDFQQISDLITYAARVPVRSYGELLPYIARQAGGEPSLLLSSHLVGWTVELIHGEARLFPLSFACLRQWRWLERLVRRQVLVHCPDASMGRWLHLLPLHRPIQWLGRVPVGPLPVLLAASGASGELAVPWQVFGLQDQELRFYLTLRLSLAQPIAVLRASSPGVFGMLTSELELQADRLLHDLASGAVSFRERLPPEVARRILPQKPQPALAALLRQQRRQRGVLHVRDVWPQLVALVCDSEGPARAPARALFETFPRAFLIDEGFRRADGALTVPHIPDRAGLPFVGHQIMEFSLATDRSRPSVPLIELEPGKRYLPIITQHNGLSRLRVERVVDVADMDEGLARLAVIGATEPRCLAYGVELTEGQIVASMEAAAEAMGVTLGGYAAWPPGHSDLPSDMAPSDLAAAVVAADWSSWEPWLAAPGGQSAVVSQAVGGGQLLCWALEPAAEPFDPQRAAQLVAAAERELITREPRLAAAVTHAASAASRLVLLRVGTLDRFAAELCAAAAVDAHAPLPRWGAMPPPFIPRQRDV